MRWIVVVWVVLISALVSVAAVAGVPERPRFRITGPTQGLPSTDIKALARDRDGYVWIGTSDGLARYDGIAMRVWRYAPGVPNGLPGNNVQALLVDASGQVWIATEGAGVSILDSTRTRFRQLRRATHPALASDDVWSIAQHDGAVWLGTFGGGVTRVDADGHMRRFDAVSGGLPSETVLSLVEDAHAVLWAGTTAGLARFDGHRFVPVALPGARKQPLIYALSVQRDGLWVGSRQGVWQYTNGHWQQPAWSPMFERPNALVSIVSMARGDHWIGSQRGLWHQQGDAPPVPIKLEGPDIPQAIATLLPGRGDALWVPVIGRGLGYLRSDWRQLARLRGAEDGLQSTMYRALGKARDGGVWLGGMGGVLAHLDAHGSIVPANTDVLARLQGIKPAAVSEDASGRVWVAHRSGLLRIGSDGTVDEWTPDDAQAPVPQGQIAWVLPDAQGTLWLAAPGGGVQQRDATTGTLLRNLPAGSASGLGEADIEAMVLSPQGQPWLAGGHGVARFDAASGRFQSVLGAGHERAFGLAFDGADRLWVQRLSGLELLRHTASGWKPVERIGAAQGMPAVAAAAVLVDARHRVWMTTLRGLYRWDPARRNVRHVAMLDEDGTEEYLERAALLRDDGVLVAATADGGLHLIDTAAADAAPARPRLRFDSVAVRRGGSWHELPLTRAVQLAPSDREVRIRARLMAYDDPPLNRYWSKVDGFDHEWVPLDASGDRLLAGLTPGRYVVHVRARDAAGNAAAEQVLTLDVPPPWWRSAWARTAYLLVGLALLWWLAWSYRQRVRRRSAFQLAEHKRELAEQASEAKSRFLATLGHEIRTPMTGVLGMSELLQKSPLDDHQHAQVGAIRRAGEHLLRLLNDALDLARIEAGKLELATTDFTLRPLLDEVAALMAPVAERKGLVFVDAIATDAPRALHGDRTRLQQILLNLIGNAVKFTERGHVAVEVFGLQPQGVRFIVTDTGPGLNAEQKARLFQRFEQADGARTAARYGGSGLGLAISQELAAAMGGRIVVESEPGNGARFIVELPLPMARALPMPAHTARPRGVGDPLRLLLVEDDPIVAEVMQGLLRAQGHTVTHAAHGLAALSEAIMKPFDAALLDLDLPGMDGLELARLLRARGVAMPLLAVTARADADAERQAQDAGFNGFLRKPVTGDLLAKALDALLVPQRAL